MKSYILFALLSLAFASCDRTANPNINTPTEAKIHFQFQFDETQERLDNLGQPAVIPQGHAAQTPDFSELSVHVIDLSPNQFTPYGQGQSIYVGAETTAGGSKAIDFDKAVVTDENIIFQTLDLSDIAPGTYEYARVSVAFQKYDVTYNIINTPFGDFNDQKGTIASFLGYNQYLTSVTPNNLTVDVNANKAQGFWAFETKFEGQLAPYNQISSGDGQGGATTVVNPLASTSPVPPGSCVITGKFAEPLVITGTEQEDITVNLAFSINNSLEWIDHNGNGQYDIDAADASQSDRPVDMGLRGMLPTWE